MSNEPTDAATDRPAIYPVIDASRPVPLMLSPIMTSDFRFLMTHLSPDEQRAQWLAEHGQAGEGEGEVGAAEEADDEGEGEEKKEEKEEKEEKDNRPVYPLLADPSDPDCGVAAASLAGEPLLSHLSPEEQHAEWRKEQEHKRVGQDKGEQAVAAGGAGENGA
ncbi:hypothetical protein JCM9279_003261 [Rhodotorula babjevae]